MNPSPRPGLVEHRIGWLLPALLLLEVAVLGLDFFTPTGAAELIFYLLPVALAAFARKPSIPVYVACVAVVCTIAGYFVSPPGAAPIIGQANRVMGVLALLCIAPLVRQIIVIRNTLEAQSWLKTAQTELAHALRGELSVDKLAERALNFLAERLGAAVGVLYVRNNGATEVSLAAGYAFDTRASTVPETCRFGEGLVGQAAADCRLISVDAVPDDYLKVSSGLGAVAPSHLVVAPLTAEGVVKGVIEFGFLQAPHPWMEALLEDTAELIGFSVRSAQYKDRLAELLAESQQQAEELQAQQEETAVLNEELEQQNRALKESQLRLENQQAELEQTNQQLEEQTQSLERQKANLLEAQRQLNDKSDELARASRYKSEFLANMSHELRTPLNSALILSKLLADNRPGNLTGDQIQYAQTIYSAGNDLLNLINDVLDLSKVEAGKLEVQKESFQLAQLLGVLERTFQPVAREKGLSLQVVVDPAVPEAISSDRQRLEQILKNFLSNAFKFTERGHVTLRIKGDHRGISLAVEDTGVGIPSDQQESVFEAFHQVDGSVSRKHGGTGLGLSISRELARLLGGEISLDSEPGRGSTFALTLPLDGVAAETAPKLMTSVAEVTVGALPATAEAAEPSPPRHAFSFEDDRALPEAGERRILIVEDDEPFARILFDLAHEMGFRGLVASTAGDALELAREYRPGAVVLDMRLPDHSGLALLDRLKSDPATRHIPVHIVSVADFATTARHLGAVGYMLKPVKRDALVQAFQDLAQRINQKLGRVLVVEDDLTQRESIVQLIGGEDVEIEAVATAEEALERLSSKIYDCMVMDLSLPAMSGYDLLAELSKTDSRYSYPPVIVYTGRDLGRDEEERLRRYSSSIIVKGARSPERLLSEVTLFLHRVESELPPERQKMLRELRSRELALDGARILLVDDDVRNIFALSSALEPHGARIETARNGREALRKLDAVPDVDLVLMDIMMPEMNGYEAMRAIRDQERFKTLPVIALTAKAMRDDHEHCLRAGASDYLAKPVDLDKLLSLLRVWLSSRRGY